MCHVKGTNENMMLGGAKHGGSNKVGRGYATRRIEWAGRVPSIMYGRGSPFCCDLWREGGMGATQRARKRTSSPKGIETLSVEAEWAQCPGSTRCDQCGWKGAWREARVLTWMWNWFSTTSSGLTRLDRAEHLALLTIRIRSLPSAWYMVTAEMILFRFFFFCELLANAAGKPHASDTAAFLPLLRSFPCFLLTDILLLILRAPVKHCARGSFTDRPSCNSVMLLCIPVLPFSLALMHYGAP